MIRLTDRLNMTIAVNLDSTNQTKLCKTFYIASWKNILPNNKARIFFIS